MCLLESALMTVVEWLRSQVDPDWMQAVMIRVLLDGQGVPGNLLRLKVEDAVGGIQKPVPEATTGDDRRRREAPRAADGSRRRGQSCARQPYRLFKDSL